MYKTFFVNPVTYVAAPWPQWLTMVNLDWLHCLGSLSLLLSTTELNDMK